MDTQSESSASLIPSSRRPEQAIRALHDMGLKIIMCTGDNRRTAESVARELGIDEFRAEVMPDEKIEIVKRLKASGAIVAMAGDGINDAPALAAADVGIAMGTGTDVAIESASITLVKGDLMGIVKAMHLSRAVMRNIRQNLFFAFMYNAVGVPIAAGVLYPFFGILLSPMIAGAAMSFSSVSVIANALRLRSDQIVAASLCEAESSICYFVRMRQLAAVGQRLQASETLALRAIRPAICQRNFNI